MEVVNNEESTVHMPGLNKQKRIFGFCYCCRSNGGFRFINLGTLNFVAVKAKNEHRSYPFSSTATSISSKGKTNKQNCSLNMTQHLVVFFPFSVD